MAAFLREIACLLLVSVLFGGCLGGGDVTGGPAGTTSPGDETKDPATPDPTRSPSPPTNTPGDGGGTVVVGGSSAVECQRPESQVKIDENATFEGGAHQHDEWGQATEKIVWDDDVVGGTSATSGIYTVARMPGAVVIPGTGRIEFTLTWTPTVAVLPETRTLQWDMPGDDRTATEMFEHEFTTSGETHGFDIGIENSDPPHYVRTTWFFRLSDDARVTWKIIKGYDCLPIDPPHYDGWGGQTQKTIVDETLTFEATRVSVAGAAYSGGGIKSPGIPAGTTVPPATGRVVVTLTWQNEHPNPVKFKLLYRTGEEGITGPALEAPPPEEPTATSRVYDLVVHPSQWDSPYKNRTAWSFSALFDNGDADAAITNSGLFKGSLRWTVEIFKLEA